MMNKTNDEVASWLYDSIYSNLDVSVIAGLKVFDYKQTDNVLDVDFEFYVLEPTHSKEHGLFDMVHGPTWTEYFPDGLVYEREKSKYIFESKEDCDSLGESGYLDLDSPYDSTGGYYKWDDSRIPEEIIADFFDYNFMGSAGVTIIEHFELLDINTEIPDCIPKRLVPHLQKAINDYLST
jgi:hypothetical protein